MGRLTKRSSSDAVGDDLRAETEQIDRLIARLRRIDPAPLGPSTPSPRSTLAKRYARFTPSGDVATDRASLAEFEQQATSLLRKAQKQRRDAVASR